MDTQEAQDTQELWTDQRIAKEAMHEEYAIGLGIAIRDDYAAKLDTLRAELDAARAMEPVPPGKFNDAWEILPDGSVSVRDHKGNWVVSDWPEGWQLMRRTQQTEVQHGE